MVLNYKAITKIIGMIILIIAISMLPSALVSLIYNEFSTLFAFIKSIIPMFIIGLILTLKTRPDSTNLKMRDGFAIVALCWLLASLLGSVPFMVSGYIPRFADAFFETASGFSTTGASILTNVEALPKGLLFWRSFTHWLGGMGILVFAIALLPTLGIAGHRIAKAETTGPTLGKLMPKMSDTAKILYIIYMVFTIVETILLLFGGMDLFDSLIHTFGSVGTGGFSSYNDSIGHFNSAYIDFVISFFMVLCGINFTLFYCVVHKHYKDLFKDGEFKVYITILISCILLISINLLYNNTYDTLGDTIRYSIFQTSSIITTTGYATTDFDLWPSFSKMILFFLMFVGGCSSSTTGCMKVIRILVLFKLIKRGIALRLHPHAVISVKLDGKAIPADRVSAITNFIFLYLGIVVLGSIIISWDNFDLITSLSAMVSCIGNIGPGFGLVGPSMNYSIFSEPIKIFLSFVMLAGRLELFTILLLLTPSFWNPDKAIRV
ncbi:TrkH family potassium uptake protein [Anaerovorax odorimutans]|uniref:TrkH family potassium uptake protein n=1 Tax=Anaerovorax odorimutans TaxID=109327 RepID=UPI00040467C7|nr:TrkH family potassium uptake protein [Anaerovorax odorimutans]